MFLSLALGHLALLSHTQRVMPGNLPDATRNQPGPREYCQVVLASRSLGAQWLPDTRAGLRAQNAAGGTYSLQHLPAFRAVTATATFCVLSHFVYTRLEQASGIRAFGHFSMTLINEVLQ